MSLKLLFTRARSLVLLGMVVVAPGERAGAADDLRKGVIQWE